MHEQRIATSKSVLYILRLLVISGSRVYCGLLQMVAHIYKNVCASTINMLAKPFRMYFS